MWQLRDNFELIFIPGVNLRKHNIANRMKDDIHNKAK